MNVTVINPVSGATEISSNPYKKEPLSKLVSLVALNGVTSSSVGLAQVEFQRRFTAQFNALLKGLKGIRSRERVLQQMFQDFYAHAAKTDLSSKSNTDTLVRHGLVEVLLQIVSPVTLADLMRRISKDANMLELCNRELRRRYYQQLKESLKNWEQIPPRFNFDPTIEEVFQCVLKNNLLKNSKLRPSADRNFLEILINQFMQQVPLDALIMLMKQPDADPSMAQRGYSEFHRRYFPRIQKLWKSWKYLGSRYDVELYTNRCFEVFYEKVVPKFMLPKGGDPNALAAVIWVNLKTIFENQAITNRENHRLNDCEAKGGVKAMQKLYGYRGEHNEYRKHRKKASAESDGVQKTSLRNDQLIKSLERLTLLEQEKNWNEAVEEFKKNLTPAGKKILVASSKYYNVFTGRCEIPEIIMEPLCKNLKITPQSLTAQRSRLLKKLKKYLASVAIEMAPPASAKTEPLANDN